MKGACARPASFGDCSWYSEFAVLCASAMATPQGCDLDYKRMGGVGGIQSGRECKGVLGQTRACARNNLQAELPQQAVLMVTQHQESLLNDAVPQRNRLYQ